MLNLASQKAYRHIKRVHDSLRLLAEMEVITQDKMEMMMHPLVGFEVANRELEAE